jgi:hypothetical protein
MTGGKAPRPSPLRRAWRRWKDWRRTRPFWGGLLVVIGGAEILLSERAPLPLIIHIGVQGLAGYFIPLIMVLAGMLLLFHPVQRTFYSLLAIMLALGSWITSNLGGFFVGLLLGVLGGSFAFAWKEREQPQQAERDDSPPPRHASSVGLALFRPKSTENQPERAPGLMRDNRGQDDGPREEIAFSPGAMPMAGIALVPLGLSMLAMVASHTLIIAQVGRPPARPNLMPSGSLTASQGPSPTLTASPSPTPTGSSSPTSTASPSSTPTGSTSPTPTGSGSPTPTASPSPSPSPTPTPSPRPKRSRIRHAPFARNLDLAATEQCSLAAGLATFAGLTYDGVAKVPTAHGTTPMLKFTMSALTLSGGTVLQLTEDGHSSVLRSWSLELRGNVVLFVTKISGRLDGIRVLFTPGKPPSGLAATLTLAGVIADHPVAVADSSLTGDWQTSGD